jgi:hypothetical protein
MRCHCMKLSADAREKDLGTIRRYLFHIAINKITRFGNRYVFIAQFDNLTSDRRYSIVSFCCWFSTPFTLWPFASD